MRWLSIAIASIGLVGFIEPSVMGMCAHHDITVNSPIYSGATLVSGTCAAAAGSIVTLYIGPSPTPTAFSQTTVQGDQTWQINLVSPSPSPSPSPSRSPGPLSVGEEVYASAGMCSASATVFVTAPADMSPPPDLLPPSDLLSLPDMSSLADLGSQADMAPFADDLSASADLNGADEDSLDLTIPVDAMPPGRGSSGGCSCSFASSQRETRRYVLLLCAVFLALRLARRASARSVG